MNYEDLLGEASVLITVWIAPTWQKFLFANTIGRSHRTTHVIKKLPIAQYKNKLQPGQMNGGLYLVRGCTGCSPEMWFLLKVGGTLE